MYVHTYYGVCVKPISSTVHRSKKKWRLKTENTWSNCIRHSVRLRRRWDHGQARLNAICFGLGSNFYASSAVCGHIKTQIGIWTKKQFLFYFYFFNVSEFDFEFDPAVTLSLTLFLTQSTYHSLDPNFESYVGSNYDTKLDPEFDFKFFA